jgi:hypothetical protein
MKRLVSLAATLALCGCEAKGVVLLTIDAQGPSGRLVVPNDLDAVTVAAFLTDGSPALAETPFTLEGKGFPVTLGVDPGPRTGSEVRFLVTGKRGEVEVTSAAAVLQIDARRVNEATVLLQVD